MSELKPPSELRMDGNLPENWRRFKQRFELYLAASGAENKEDRVQASLLLHIVGEDALEVFNTFNFEDEADKRKLNVIMDKFEAYCLPRRNITFERNRFFSYNQGSETIDQYVTELKKRASSCEFGDLTNSMIRDRIVCGITDQTQKERLLRITDLTLEKAVEICRAAEVSQAQIQDLNGEQKINFIKKREKPKTKERPNHGANNYRKEVRTNTFKPIKSSESKSHCSYCGTFHEPRSCPAFGKKCNFCNALNHFARQCRNKKPKQKFQYQVDNLEGRENDFFIGALDVNAINNTDTQWTETLTVNGKPVKFKLDSGAQVNVLPRNMFEEVKEHEILLPTTAEITGYSGYAVPVLGKVKLSCRFGEQTHELLFYIVDVKAEPILGKVDCENLGFISRVYEIKNEYDHLVEEFSDVFTGIGCLEKQYEIKIDSNVQPVINPPRRIPEALKERLREELDRMVQQEIIAPIEGTTEWLHNPVIVEKPDGKLRVCLDPKDLNRAIIKEPFIIPTLSELSVKMRGAKYFSILDANCGFWQIQLTDKSTDLCAFSTPFGRYKFLRLPFGINSAPEFFQKIVQDVFGDLIGVDNYFDDILVAGSTKVEHDHRLRQALQRSREKNLKLKLEKCEFGVKRVKFLGHYLSEAGIEVDPSKSDAILKMPVPANRKDLERFLGMVTYLAKFISNLSSETAPLRELLKDGIEWHWSKVHDESFKRLKNLISEPPVLKFFDAAKPVVISVDASKEGLGAVLLQDNCPISFASRTLTNSEKNYAQIEKEMLAIVYGVERFHQFVYGREVRVESDHKPLECIIKKPLVHAPARLQRFLLRLQKYQIVVSYKPGKDLLTADTLSRASLPVTDLEEEVQLQIHELVQQADAQVKMSMNSLPISENRLEEFRKATAKDTNLTMLSNVILSGWPRERVQVPESLKCYWNIRDELNTNNGLVFKGHKLVVPQILQSEMLTRLHETHMGVEKTKEKARDCLYWETMNKDIEAKVKHCNICEENQRNNSKEPLLSHEVPHRPWQMVGADLYEWKNQQYLLVVDYYSKYVEVALMERTRSIDIIIHLKSMFARHGIADTLVTDNGSQFCSRDFNQFMTAWDIQHITPSPTYPKANGMAERTVQTVKNMLKKSKDPYLGLLELRTTPFKDLKASPAQLLMGRRLKTRIPVSAELLKPVTVDHNLVRNNLIQRQAVQKNYYDRTAHPLLPFAQGDSVRVRRNGKWEPAKVNSRTEHPRSYIVETSSGKLRRNRYHLKPNYSTQFRRQIEDDDDCQVLVSNERPPGAATFRNEMTPRVEEPSSVTTTRSGRTVKKPSRFSEQTI